MSDDPFEKARQANGLWEGREPYPDLQDDYRFAQPLDYIPITKAPMRNRKWEKKNKARAFRCISPNMQQDVRNLAKAENLTADDLVNALLDYGLTCYERGTLKLEPELSKYRRTLLPERGWDGKTRVRWLEERWTPNPQRQTRAKEKLMHSEQAWKEWPIAAYRISPDVLNRLDALRQKLMVSAGDIVMRLLIHAMLVYREGNLVFQVEGEVDENPETEHKLNESDWKPK